MTERPLVSVIVPAYNAEATLGAALSSALTQTYPHVEVVVCNDGSSDATSAIAHAHANAFPDRVKVLDQVNTGLPGARNAAIEAAHGELLSLLDSDDVFLPPHLDRAVSVFESASSPRTMVSSNAFFLSRHGILPSRRIYTRGGAVPPENQRLRMLEGNIASIFSTFPRSMWEELGGFSPEMKLMEDYDLWMRAVFSGWRIAVVEEPTALYRLTSGSLSSKAARMAEYDKIVHRRLSDAFRASMTAAERELLDALLTHDTAQQYIDRAAERLAQGDTDEASALLAQAARLAPSNRRLLLKARALRYAPFVGPLYARREAQRLRETSR